MWLRSKGNGMKKLMGLIAGLAASLALSGAALAQAKMTVDKGDTAWMMVSTLLVILMTVPGLALFYGGMVRSKNTLSVLMQVFVTFCLIAVVWVVYGYSMTFTGGNAFFGGFSKLFLSGVTGDSLGAIRKIFGGVEAGNALAGQHSVEIHHLACRSRGHHARTTHVDVGLCRTETAGRRKDARLVGQGAGYRGRAGPPAHSLGGDASRRDILPARDLETHATQPPLQQVEDSMDRLAADAQLGRDGTGASGGHALPRHEGDDDAIGSTE